MPTDEIIVIDKETSALIAKVTKLTAWEPLKVVKVALRSYVWLRKHVNKSVALSPSDLLQLLTGKDIDKEVSYERYDTRPK
jgi:hypothetical protein